MCKSSGPDPSAEARRQEYERQQRIRQGTQSINTTFDETFTPAFFAGRRTGFLDYANPQVQRQYEDEVQRLGFALTDRGLTNSSVRADLFADLEEQLGRAQREMADRALAYENEARTAAEGERSNLINILSSTANADAAAQGAVRQAEALSRPVAYDPIGQLFVDATAALATQAQAERRGTARFPTGLFQRNNSVVVR